MAKDSVKTKPKAKDTEARNVPEVLMRFTTLTRLFEMIELNGIPLGNGAGWDDQVDRAFVDCARRRLNAKRCGVLCFMDCNHPVKGQDEELDQTEYVLRRETVAHWKAYGSPGDFAIRIEFDGGEISRALGKLSESENMNPAFRKWFEPVKYRSLKECRELAENKSNDEELFFAKRYAYEWEHECRMVILNQTPVSPMERKGVEAFVKLDLKKAIKTVVFSPFVKPCPAWCGTPGVECLRRFALKCFEEWGNLERREAVRETLEILLGKNQSHRSRVLDNDSLLKACDASTPKCLYCKA